MLLHSHTKLRQKRKPHSKALMIPKFMVFLLLEKSVTGIPQRGLLI